MSEVEIPRGNHVALVSGGDESTVAAHAAVRFGPADLLVYLDTRTGAEENRRYVERLADHLEVQLWTLRTSEDYGEKVHEEGFPGPSRHGMFYNSLKERQIDRLATMCAGRGHKSDLHLWTGVRRRESMQRMGRVDPIEEAERWTWHAPICNWSIDDVRRYRRRFRIPKNPLWDTLGRSGDCFCGCFGSPEELIDAEAAGCDRIVRKLRSLEASTDAEDEKGRWAWGGAIRGGTPCRARRRRSDDSVLGLWSYSAH